MPFNTSLRTTCGVATMIFEVFHKSSRFFGILLPVIETASTFLMTFFKSFKCWSTSALVGAINSTQPCFECNISAINIQETAVFPAAVGNTSNIDPASASSTASS